MIRTIQNAFTSGEISPQLYARGDQSKYSSGCRTLKNFIIRPYGGVQRRPGFRFIAEVKDSTKKTWLKSFEHSIEQAYILEFGDRYIRFYMDGGQITVAGNPLEIGIPINPYLEEDLDYLKFCQSADMMFIAHSKYPPMSLSRTSHTNWTLEEITFDWPPFRDINKTEITIGAGAQTGNTYLIASDDLFLDPQHIGTYWTLHNGYAKITSITNPTTALVTIIKDLDYTASTTEWAEGAWSDYRGWPFTVCFDNDDRLVFGGNNSEPQRLWGSVIGDYYNHETNPNEDDKAWKHRIGGLKVNVIRSLLSAKRLMVFTSGGEWQFGGDEVTTPFYAPRSKETMHGSIHVQPIEFGNGAIFLQRPGKTLRYLQYEDVLDRYIGNNLSLWADHLLENNMVISMAYQQNPNQVIWLIRDDGVLLSLTILPEQEVIGWAKHTTDGGFEDVAVIPGDDEDEVWVIVKRLINGSEKRYVERLDPSFKEDESENAFFVDSGLTYDGSPTTTITGLDHLEGKEVAILADGATVPSKTVSSGSITLDSPASVVHVGLPYESDLETLNIDVPLSTGTIQGMVKKITEVTVRFHKTFGGWIGPDEDHLKEMKFWTSPPYLAGEPVPLFTGDKKMSMTGGYNENGRVFIRQQDPLPMTVLGVISEVEI